MTLSFMALMLLLHAGGPEVLPWPASKSNKLLTRETAAATLSSSGGARRSPLVYPCPIKKAK